MCSQLAIILLAPGLSTLAELTTAMGKVAIAGDDAVAIIRAGPFHIIGGGQRLHRQSHRQPNVIGGSFHRTVASIGAMRNLFNRRLSEDSQVAGDEAVIDERLLALL